MKKVLQRAAIVSVAGFMALGLSACSGAASASTGGSDAKSTVYFGVSAAETGPYAQYGQQFKEAFDLAAEQVNANGGINGHPVALKYEDSQSDPKQSVPVAQKFVGDSSVVLVFGDYSSAASIPASPIYTAGKLLQYGFNNSNPDFTAKGTQYQWSSSITTAATYSWTADYIKKQGIKSVGVTYLNTADWGIPAYQAFQAEAKKVGLKITDAEGVLDTSDDYKPSLIKAVADKPQAFVHIGYGPDAAKIVSQLRSIGYDGTFYGGQDEESFDGTSAAEGAVNGSEFVETSSAPNVKAFVKAFTKKYPKETDVTSFEAGAYDALNVAVAAAEKGGITREGILKGFSEIKNVPSVVYGKITFDPNTRRVASPKLTPTTLKGGKWVVYNG
ncbi:ABC transporter substrate-binding protein [Planctomonas sp. JC2975]|uniref:ABC transporter substrate-binding protein n=1 Tax=Planctomonas sp. JC2975 TaxID=2729626 RepID=UPI001473103D|nr:ABC transporter substrate-binding protein [Planctomonas sp. JC2975]NNC13667.1 ABC transporter substrate-binding protein [Planctomonas sp. JC2975]